MVKTDADGKIYDAFTDPELRYRMRYVDLVVNPKVKDTFVKRTKIVNAMRNFFNLRETHEDCKRYAQFLQRKRIFGS